MKAAATLLAAVCAILMDVSVSAFGLPFHIHPHPIEFPPPPGSVGTVELPRFPFPIPSRPRGVSFPIPRPPVQVPRIAHPHPHFSPPAHRGGGSVEATAAETVAKCKQGLDNNYSPCGASNYDAKKCCSYRSGLVKACSKTPYYHALQTLLKNTCS